MIRISKKTDYAIFIMGYLGRRAIETVHGDESRSDLVSAQELASVTTLNKSVIANLLKDLTRAGLLNSARGVHGGYRLAYPAGAISLGQILEALEGPLTLVECSSTTPTNPSSRDAATTRHPCCLRGFCTTGAPLQVLQERIGALIHELKLTELCALPTTATQNRQPTLTPNPATPNPAGER